MDFLYSNEDLTSQQRGLSIKRDKPKFLTFAEYNLLH